MRVNGKVLLLAACITHGGLFLSVRHAALFSIRKEFFKMERFQCQHFCYSIDSLCDLDVVKSYNVCFWKPIPAHSPPRWNCWPTLPPECLRLMGPNRVVGNGIIQPQCIKTTVASNARISSHMLQKLFIRGNSVLVPHECSSTIQYSHIFYPHVFPYFVAYDAPYRLISTGMFLISNDFDC